VIHAIGWAGACSVSSSARATMNNRSAYWTQKLLLYNCRQRVDSVNILSDGYRITVTCSRRDISMLIFSACHFLMVQSDVMRSDLTKMRLVYVSRRPRSAKFSLIWTFQINRIGSIFEIDGSCQCTIGDDRSQSEQCIKPLAAHWFELIRSI